MVAGDLWIAAKQQMIRQQWRKKDMATTATKSPLVDKDGYVNLDDMVADYQYLLKLEHQKKLIEEAIDVYKAKLGDRVKSVQGAIGAKIGGVSAFTCKQDATFRKKEFLADNPHIAEQHMTWVKQLNTETLQHVHPDLYAKYRGYSFKLAR